jgi:hypothetical protein
VTATPTVGRTPVASDTPPANKPTIAATPSAGETCENGRVDEGEECDGNADGACPTLCLSDCSCPRYFEVPLDGWVRSSGRGTWTVRRDDRDAPGPVLVTRTEMIPSTGFAIRYPSDGSLDLKFPFLAFTMRSTGGSSLEVEVRPTRGPVRMLVYEASDKPPALRKRRAVFPIGTDASGQFRTVHRDLAADLEAAFGLVLASVERVELHGSVTVSSIMFADRGDAERTAASDSLSLPLERWSQRGRGQIFQNEYDPTLGGSTLRSEPSALKGALELSYPPRSGASLIAGFRTLSFAVRDEAMFWVEITLRTSDGKSSKLRYQTELSKPRIRHRRALLPLVLRDMEGSPYKLAIVDLAGDLAMATPEAAIDSVLGIRLHGRFRVGDVVLTDPIE